MKQLLRPKTLCLVWCSVLLWGVALPAAAPQQRPVTATCQRPGGHSGRHAVAGGVRGNDSGPVDAKGRRRIGCGSHSTGGALWRRHRGGAAREAAAILIGHRRQAGTGVRRPFQRQHRARDQRDAVLVSGYNEILTGFPDSRIDSNNRIPNPNVTVLEWLHGRPGFTGKVAAFASWELLPVDPQHRTEPHPRQRLWPPDRQALNRTRASDQRRLADLPPYWGETRADAPTGFGALEYLKKNRPRVLYVMLGETDEWAHGRRYDLYLDSAWRATIASSSGSGKQPRRCLATQARPP